MTEVINSTSLDAMFDTLGNSYRRRILLAVSDHNPRTEDEFTPEMFGTDDADEKEIERMKIALFHSHLPKLADAGYIEWTPETETIRRGPNFEEIAPLLGLMVKYEDEVTADCHDWLMKTRLTAHRIAD